jgi:hypothetical protein
MRTASRPWPKRAAHARRQARAQGQAGARSTPAGRTSPPPGIVMMPSKVSRTTVSNSCQDDSSSAAPIDQM